MQLDPGLISRHTGGEEEDTLWMFLPCDLWVGSQLPWRTSADASPPQLEDILAVIRHLEEQDLQKNINRSKTQF